MSEGMVLSLGALQYSQSPTRGKITSTKICEQSAGTTKLHYSSKKWEYSYWKIGWEKLFSMLKECPHCFELQQKSKKWDIMWSMTMPIV